MTCLYSTVSGRPIRWQIRPKESEDVDELRRLYMEARLGTFARLGLNTSAFTLTDFDVVTEGEEIWVAVSDGKLIGFVSCWLPDQFIHSLYVDPGFLRQGVGKALLRECLSKLGRPAFLKCLQQNTNAIAFYKQQGWQIKSEGISHEGLYFLMTIDD